MIRKTEDGEYTLRKEVDGEETEPARPPDFSHPDRHGEFRRKTKKMAGESG